VGSLGAAALVASPASATVGPTNVITFAAPASGLVGNQSTLAPTASSGLTVTLTVDGTTTNGACTILGDTVSYVNPGRCIIDANQPGDGVTYGPAAQVQQAITVVQTAPTGDAIVPGFNTNILPANDDGSTGQVTLPFLLDFFGNTYSSLWVNNNGNLTFNGPLSAYTPSGLSTYGSPIIAPYWADVMTDPSDSGLVTYGDGMVDGHEAFGVNWPGVACFSTNNGGLNYFQVLLIDRSDIAPGDFDIEYNYDQIQWETGQASGGNGECRGGASAQVGYTNGHNALELAGSGVNGAFIDGGPDSLIAGSQNSPTPGQYIFQIRATGEGGTISGNVTGTGTPVAGAIISACQQNPTNAALAPVALICYRGNTDGGGNYTLLGVAPGSYDVTVSPPSGSPLNGNTQGPDTVTTNNTTVQNFTMTGPTPPPDGTVVTGVGTTTVGGNQVPIINWNIPAPFSTQACPGGTVSVTITAENTQTGQTQTVPNPALQLTEGPPGTFTGTLPAVYPMHGAGTVTMTITCPDPTDDSVVPFSIYIDPSGTVVDSALRPISGATVTLLTSDSQDGTFTAVPSGSAIMSQGNRVNPDTTSLTGHFGWDTVPGWYEVQASKNGCTVTTPAFSVPPPVSNLQIVLNCQSAEIPASPPGGLSAAPGDGSVALSWSQPASFGNSPLAGYNVYVGTSSNHETVIPVLVTTTHYTVTGLTDGTEYYFYVTAVNMAGWSGPSEEASATPEPPPTVPGVPLNLSATPGGGSANLIWTTPTDTGGSPITGYNVFDGTSAGGESSTPVNGGVLVTGTSLAVSSLTNGTTYYFTVAAVNAVGSSLVSNEASATPAPVATTTSLTLSRSTVAVGSEQKVKFSVAVTGSSPTGTVSLSAGSNTLCTVTLSSGSGSCRIGSRSLPKGSYSVVASYSGDTNNNASSSGAVTLKVR